MGASPKVLKAALEAGLVESNLRNLDYGDRDSLGVFQQRPSQGWGRPDQVTRPRYAARQFFKRAIPLRKQYGSAGELAQAVQRSAFPERYDQRSADAESILQSLGSGPGARQRLAGQVAGQYGVRLPDVDPRVVMDALRQQRERPVVPVSAPPLPAFAAGPVAAGRTPASSGGPVSRGPGLEEMLAAVRTAGGLPGAVQGATEPKSAAGPSRRPGGAAKAVPVRAARVVDSWAEEFGVPVTAREEPGHAVGGDHDPSVRGATARDYGGSEEARRRLFRRITRELGVKGARFKGDDINVTVNGVRWQIISRDHGTGPHLHVGWRRVK